MELVFCKEDFYRVKKGQRVKEIAAAFGLPPRVLIGENALTCEVQEGQILAIPHMCGNLYEVRGGESKSLLCGSPQSFQARNNTKCLYPTQVVLL